MRMQALIGGVLVCVAPGFGQIVTDGSVGAVQNLTGSDVRVAPELGQTRGANLFHSFARFNVNAGQRVAFDPGNASRIISRVTGGEISRIDGTLAALGTRTDLYLINPTGAVFGPGASIELPGQFVVSTADTVTFADGATLNATPQATDTLSAADPTAFGFLPGGSGLVRFAGTTVALNDASITAQRVEIDGATIASTGSFLGIGGLDGETLQFIAPGVAGLILPDALPGGDVTIANGSTITLESESLGGLTLAGDRVSISGSQIGFASASPEEGSVLAITSRRLTMREQASLVTLAVASVQGPGVVIGPGVIDMDRSTMASASLLGTGGPIQIQGRELRMTRGSSISATNAALSSSGDLLVRVDEVALRGSQLSTRAEAETAGNAGFVQVIAKRVNLRDGAAIRSDSAGLGSAGDLIIRATDAVQVRGQSQINSSSFEQGQIGTGAIEIVSPNIIVDRSLVLSATSGAGVGKSVTLTTTPDGSVTLKGVLEQVDTGGIGTFSLGQATEGVAGNSASVAITTGTLLVRDGASINATSASSGRAGDVTIDARQIDLVGTGTGLESAFFTAVVSQTESEQPGAGDAGDILLTGGTLRMSESATISSSTLGTGSAGNVRIDMDEVLLFSGAQVGSVSGVADDPASGAAGSVDLTGRSLVRLADGSTINVSGEQTAAGSIAIGSDGSILILNGSAVGAVSGAAGGNITLAAGDTIGVSDSQITARAAGSGESAQVALQGARTAALGNSLIDGTASGIDVLVSITADDVLLAGSTEILSDRTVIPFTQNDVSFLVSLPIIGLDQSARLQQDCRLQTIGNSSSFTVEGRGGVNP